LAQFLKCGPLPPKAFVFPSVLSGFVKVMPFREIELEDRQARRGSAAAPAALSALRKPCWSGCGISFQGTPSILKDLERSISRLFFDEGRIRAPADIFHA